MKQEAEPVYQNIYLKASVTKAKRVSSARPRPHTRDTGNTAADREDAKRLKTRRRRGAALALLEGVKGQENQRCPPSYFVGILARLRAMASSTAFSCFSSSSRRDSVLLGLLAPAAEPGPPGRPPGAAGPFPDDLGGGDRGRFLRTRGRRSVRGAWSHGHAGRGSTYLSPWGAAGRGPWPRGRSMRGESGARRGTLLSRPEKQGLVTGLRLPLATRGGDRRTSVGGEGHPLAGGGARPALVRGQVPLPAALVPLLLLAHTNTSVNSYQRYHGNRTAHLVEEGEFDVFVGP